MRFKLLGVLAFLLVLFSNSIVKADFLKEGQLSLKTGEVTMPSFSDLIEELGPSVVNISVEGDSESGQEISIPGLPFQLKPDNKMPVRSLGSGFVVDETGYIVTNNHVVEKAEKVVVRLATEKDEYPAEVVARDKKTDLALLKIKYKGKLKAVFIGNSDELKVGDWVLAIGNPFELGQTVTAGIVSAKSRKVPSGGPYDDFIQTDASINPGNSGGPLFNTKGQVVGINTAIFSPGRSQFGGTGFNIGIGFATPINLAKGVLQQLKDKGKVVRGWLGVLIQKVSPDVALALGLDNYSGALVADVMDGSPAKKAGLLRGDVIIKFNGKEVKENDDLPLMVANTALGSTVQIELVRKGAKMTVDAKITELKDEAVPKEKDEPKANNIGLVVQDITDDIAKSLNLPSQNGVIVTDVQSGSAADKAGVLRGDVIEELAGKVVSNSNVFASLVSEVKKGKPVLLLVRRQVGTLYLTLKLD